MELSELCKSPIRLLFRIFSQRFMTPLSVEIYIWSLLAQISTPAVFAQPRERHLVVTLFFIGDLKKNRIYPFSHKKLRKKTADSHRI